MAGLRPGTSPPPVRTAIVPFPMHQTCATPLEIVSGLFGAPRPLLEAYMRGVPVKLRPLGATGYSVSEIGYGGWGLGADMWRGVDDGQTREALRAAVDEGITFFDTALAYGTGHSERVIGEVLRDDIRAGGVRVATKVPPLNNEWPGRANRPLAA